jgi:hypothetical protein
MTPGRAGSRCSSSTGPWRARWAGFRLKRGIGHVAVALGSEEHIVEALDHVMGAVIERAHGDVAQSIVERPEQSGDAALSRCRSDYLSDWEGADSSDLS